MIVFHLNSAIFYWFSWSFCRYFLLWKRMWSFSRKTPHNVSVKNVVFFLFRNIFYFKIGFWDAEMRDFEQNCIFFIRKLCRFPCFFSQYISIGTYCRYSIKNSTLNRIISPKLAFNLLFKLIEVYLFSSSTETAKHFYSWIARYGLKKPRFSRTMWINVDGLMWNIRVRSLFHAIVFFISNPLVSHDQELHLKNFRFPLIIFYRKHFNFHQIKVKTSSHPS